MRIAYFDCFAGVSGEMLLGALIGAGLSLDALQGVLSGLALVGYELSVQKVLRRDLPGTYLSVIRNNTSAGCDPVEERIAHANGRLGAGTCPSTHLIGNGRLPDLVKQTSLAIFRRLAQAEAAVLPHGGRVDVTAWPVEEIVPVVGAVAGLFLLGISRVECSPVHVGGGVLCGTEGVRPALSPVTAEILRTASVPVYGSHVAGELVTPIGAAIIATISSAFGGVPPMRIDSVGYGAGKYDLAEAPNMIRLFIGDAKDISGGVRKTQELAAADEGRRTKDEGRSAAMQPNGTSQLPASLPPAADTSIPNSQDWAAHTIVGHQQSGRQRLVS